MPSSQRECTCCPVLVRRVQGRLPGLSAVSAMLHNQLAARAAGPGQDELRALLALPCLVPTRRWSGSAVQIPATTRRRRSAMTPNDGGDDKGGRDDKGGQRRRLGGKAASSPLPTAPSPADSLPRAGACFPACVWPQGPTSSWPAGPPVTERRAARRRSAPLARAAPGRRRAPPPARHGPGGGGGPWRRRGRGPGGGACGPPSDQIT